MATYPQAVAYLESFINYERVRRRMRYDTRALDLRRFERFLRSIGSPHLAVPVIHIAGTKGKGSTAAIIHSILTEAGLRSGLYTSPHIQSYCERIQINRKPISKRRFAEAVESLHRRLEQRSVELDKCYRTTFELLTTAAFEVFRDRQVDLAVIETGLGGRLDATNVVRPEIAVITAIGMDHTHILGRTLRAIAREKAGIIKKRRPVVLARQAAQGADEAIHAIRTVCMRRHAPLYYVPRHVAIVGRSTDSNGQLVELRLGRPERNLTVRLPLPGRHQAENLATALAVVEILRARGWPVSDQAIAAGAERVNWSGRIEIIHGRPPIVLDGAHCHLSSGALVETLRELWPTGRPVFLFSILDDKPVESVMAPVAGAFGGSEVIVFQAPGPRGRPARTLVKPLEELGFRASVARGATDALRKAVERVQAGSPIVAFGTLYSIARLKKARSKLTHMSGHCKGSRGKVRRAPGF